MPKNIFLFITFRWGIGVFDFVGHVPFVTYPNKHLFSQQFYLLSHLRIQIDALEITFCKYVELFQVLYRLI